MAFLVTLIEIRTGFVFSRLIENMTKKIDLFKIYIKFFFLVIDNLNLPQSLVLLNFFIYSLTFHNVHL